MRPHHLFTAELALLPATRANFRELWELWSEPDIGPHLFGPRPVTLGMAAAIFNAQQQSLAKGLGTWLVKTITGQRPIGFVSLARRAPSHAPQDVAHGAVELRLAMRHGARGLGCATQAARAVIRHAFAIAPMPFIAARCEAEDAAPSRLLARLGFEATAVYATACGTSRCYLLTREAFDAGRMRYAGSPMPR